MLGRVGGMKATESQPDRQPGDTRGVWRIDRPGRPLGFGVQWRERAWDEKLNKETVRRPTEFFATKDEREARYAEIAANKRSGTPSSATRADLRQWQAFTTAAAGVPWQEILSGYHAHLAATGHRPCTETVATYGKTYLAAEAAKMKRGELSEDGERHKRRAIGELMTRLGHLPLDHPTASAVEKMIDEMGNGHAPTFNGYRKLYFAFFNRAVEERVIKENPIASMKPRRFHVDNRGRILTPQQTAQLFAFALDHALFKVTLGRLALEFFLGVRFSSSYRSTKEDINFAERTVLLPAKKLKTGKESGVSHMVDTVNFPGLEVLWEWLKIAPDGGWVLEPRTYMDLKSQLFNAAGVPHPQNCARKSFATYDLAAHRNPGRTAYILGHVDQEELWADYKGNATQLEGRLYQAIAPSTCREIALTGRLPAPSPRRKGRVPPGGS